MKCDNCGHRISKWDTICSHCGKPVNSGYINDPYTQSKLLQNEQDITFTFISPDEKVLGEFRPSSKVKSYLTRQRLLATALQSFLFLIPSGSVLTVPTDIRNPSLFIPLIIYIAFVIAFSVVPTYLYLKRLSRTVYIITDKRVIFTKPKGKALSKSIPRDTIEAAIAVSSPSSSMIYYSVFFPEKGQFDMKGIDTSLPVTPGILVRIEKKDAKIDPVKPKIRHLVKSVRRMSKLIRKRSFLFLDEVDALKAVKLFNNKNGQDLVPGKS